jgi:type II secretory pathway component PulM
MRWPHALTRAFDAAGVAKRRASIAFVLVAAVVLTVIVASPLRDAVARAREDLARSRLVLDVARARAAESATLVHASVPAKAGDVRTAIERVLAAHGLRHAPVAGQTPDGAIVIEATPFDALVRALDALARDEGVRVVEATLTARVDPGTVRAELVLAR